MKKITILAIIVIFLGCARLPEVPPVNLSGVMNIKIIKPEDFAFGNMKGMFIVNGIENKFIIYFQDMVGFPRGRVVVKGREVILDGIEFDRNFFKMFKYWPYIFGFGVDERDSLKLGDVIIKYSGWKKLNGRNYPLAINISAPEFAVHINIIYGKKSSSEN